MPVSFKPNKDITIATKTPEEDLVYCPVCGGLQAMSKTALDINCPACGGTGYANLWTFVDAVATYRPGARTRWNYVAGAVDYFGECSIKLDYRYKPVLDQASHIVMDGTEWKFSVLRDPGEAMGQQRLVVALSRK